MAKNNNLQDFLTDIADAIREKKGTTDKINPLNFSSEIKALSSLGGDESEIIVCDKIYEIITTDIDYTERFGKFIVNRTFNNAAEFNTIYNFGTVPSVGSGSYYTAFGTAYMPLDKDFKVVDKITQFMLLIAGFEGDISSLDDLSIEESHAILNECLAYSVSGTSILIGSNSKGHPVLVSRLDSDVTISNERYEGTSIVLGSYITNAANIFMKSNILDFSPKPIIDMTTKPELNLNNSLLEVFKPWFISRFPKNGESIYNYFVDRMPLV